MNCFLLRWSSDVLAVCERGFCVWTFRPFLRQPTWEQQLFPSWLSPLLPPHRHLSYLQSFPSRIAHTARRHPLTTRPVPSSLNLAPSKQQLRFVPFPFFPFTWFPLRSPAHTRPRASIFFSVLLFTRCPFWAAEYLPIFWIFLSPATLLFLFFFRPHRHTPAFATVCCLARRSLLLFIYFCGIHSCVVWFLIFSPAAVTGLIQHLWVCECVCVRSRW